MAGKKGYKMFVDFLKDNYANLFSLLNIFVLVITLGVLLGYAYDTRKIAKQAKEGNLRPVVLRSGYVTDWNDVKSRTIKILSDEEIKKILSEKKVKENEITKLDQPQPLEFSILKNIATDINGFVIVDDYKYSLVFGSDISKKKYNEQFATMNFNLNWGWMKAGTKIYAFIDAQTKNKSDEDNQIYIRYKDIEGNRYYSKEDRNFSHKSFPLKR